MTRPDRLTVTVCGSLTRAATDINRVAWHLKAAGHDVYQPTPKPDDVTAPTAGQIHNITAGHYAAIDRSHLVVAVINDGRPGAATTAEILHAISRRIPVRIAMDADEIGLLIADITAGRIPDRSGVATDPTSDPGATALHHEAVTLPRGGLAHPMHCP